MSVNLLANYLRLLEQVDTLAARISEQLGEHIVCGPGCSGCCQPIGVLPVEAFALRRALKQSGSDTHERIRHNLQSTESNRCPLLHDRHCLLYQARPVICRTQGLPLMVREKGSLRIDYCPLNFKKLEALPGELTIDLDRLNQILVAVDLHFRKQTETTAERLSIADVLRQGI